MLKLIKFVSMRTLYGGLSVALYLPKSAADWVSTRLSLGSSRNLRLFDSPLLSTPRLGISLGLIMRLTAANCFVFSLFLPIVRGARARRRGRWASCGGGGDRG